MTSNNLFGTGIVELSSGFNRSTNLELDFQDSEKLKNIFITSKFEQGLIEVLDTVNEENSNQRVRVLSGSPGLGKSTFALFVANVLNKKNPRITKPIVAEAQTPNSKDLIERLDTFSTKRGNKLLPVFLNGFMGNIEDAFIEQLEKAFEATELHDEFKKIIKTSSKKRWDIVAKWKKSFPEIYGKYVQFLEFEGEDLVTFEKSLKRGTVHALEVFERVYLQITGGVSSAEKSSGNVISIYREAIKLLKANSFSGIFVIYDEFGKYLEKGIHSPSSLNVQFLQDFAEFCDRSGNGQCHLTLITHMSVSQYAVQLPVAVQKEWAKIEGRFQETSFYDRGTNYYKLISNVFVKTIEETSPSLYKRVKKINSSFIKGFAGEKDGLAELVTTKKASQLVTSCYPLHPLTLALLPYLSQKVAQNERTLYTFLTRDEENSLKRFIDNGIDEDNEEFLMPSHLYDYFEPLISKDTGVGGAYRIALVAEEAFNKIEQEDSLSREIVSIVALASVIKNARVIPSTKKFLTQSLCTMAHATQVEAAIKDLVEKKVLLYNRMIGQYELQQGSSVDIQEEIEKLRSKKLTSKDLTSIVKRYYPVDYIIPKRYNFEHSITRFYKNEIISVEELVQGKISTNPNYSTEDALLYYVIPFDQDELNLAKRYIEEIDHKLVAFVLPKSFVECRKDIEELNAINSLFSNRELLSAGPLVKKELEKHRDITLNAIHALLDSLVGKSRLSATIYYPRKSKQYSAESYSLLQRVLGDVLEEEYSRSVDINSELINKHKVSGTVSLARRKLIDSIGKNFDQKRLGIEGNGPEYAIYKALQGLSGFKYDEIMKRYALNDDRFTSLLKDYKNFIKTNVRGVTMEEIISFFIAPPFGLRRGVIPLYLALFDKCLTHPVNHYFDSKYQTIVDGDHYDLMLKHPKLSIIQYTDISEKKIGFLKSLESIFKVNESDITVYSVVESIFKWRKSIPDSTKASHSISVEGRKLLIAIDSSKEPDRLVFNLIPAALGIGDDIEDLSDEKILDLAKNLFKEIGLINNIYPMLVRSIKTSLYQNLNFWRVRCLGVSEVKEDKSGNVAKHYHETLTLFEETLLNYPFSKATSKFLGRISTFDSSKHPQYFIETVADSLTGVNPRHWDIKHQSLFDVALKQSQSEIEMVSEFVNPEFKGKTAVAFIDNETGEKKYIKLSDRSLLSTDIQNAAVKIEQILDKLSIEERNEILLRLLNPVLTQNGNVKKTTLKK